MQVQEISPKELKQLIDQKADLLLVDVREQEEHDLVALPGSLLVPLMQVEQRLEELRALCSEAKGEVVVYCRSGGRSDRAIRFLQSCGFGENLKNLVGGINAYAVDADTSLQPY